VLLEAVAEAARAFVVLLVEDDDDVRDVMTEILVARRLVVVAARDGVEALALLARLTTPPDLVVLDLMMPRLDGAGFLAAARMRDPDFARVPVVVISAAGEGGARLLPPEAVSAWLTKPIELGQLLDVVARLSDGRLPATPAMRHRLLAYLARTREDLVRLRAAIQSADHASVERIAHELEATCRSFGAGQLAAAAAALIDAAAERDAEAVARAVRALADAVFALQTTS
jgi:twitching motility two-component system response regulator PilH